MPYWDHSCLRLVLNGFNFNLTVVECQMHPNQILNDYFIFSCSSANEAANTCTESNSSGFCQPSGFLVFDIDIEWLFNVPPRSFVSLLYLLPTPTLLSSPSPERTATRPLWKDDLCYHQHPTKWIDSPTGLLRWSATRPCLHDDTWLLTYTGAHHGDNRKWRDMTFLCMWTDSENLQGYSSLKGLSGQSLQVPQTPKSWRWF